MKKIFGLLVVISILGSACNQNENSIKKQNDNCVSEVINVNKLDKKTNLVLSNSVKEAVEDAEYVSTYEVELKNGIKFYQLEYNLNGIREFLTVYPNDHYLIIVEVEKDKYYQVKDIAGNIIRNVDWEKLLAESNSENEIGSNEPCYEQYDNFGDCMNCVYGEMSNDWLWASACMVNPWSCIAAAAGACALF